MLRTSGLRRLASLAVLALTAACIAKPASAQNDAAWKLLWGNKLAAAETQFRAELKAKSNDADALRGLGWIYYYKDDQFGLVRCWSRAIALNPADPTTAGLWPLLLQTVEPTRDLAPAAPAAKAILASPGSSTVLKLSAQLLLAHALDKSSGIAAGDAYRRSFATITDWRVIGPFDNVSKSGLNKQFRPEQEIRFADGIPGKDDHILSWRHCPLIDHDGVVAVGTYLGDTEPNVFYAATSVEAPHDTDAYITLDNTGASKLFVNGSQVFSDSVYRDFLSDVPAEFSVPVHLHEGWNTLLLKVADDKTSVADFDLQMIDKSGAPLHLTAVDASKADGASLVGTSELDAVAPAHTDIQMLLTRSAASIEESLLLGLYLDKAGDYQSSEDILNAAISSHPNCAALYAQLSDTLNDDGQTDDSRAALDSARLLDHDMASTELSYLVDQKDAGTKAAYVKQMQALALKFPASSNILFGVVGALQDADQNDQAFRVAQKAAALGGSSGVYALDTEYEFDDHEPEITKMVKAEALADPANGPLWDSYATDLSQLKNYSAGIAAYQHAIAVEPDSTMYLQELAQAYRDAGMLAKAVPEYALYAHDCPLDAEAQSKYGQALEDQGKTAAAIAQYDLAVQLDPSKVDLRDKLQLLTGQKPVADLVPAQPTPNLDKLRGKPVGDAPPAVYLIDEEREVVYPDYATQSRFHEVIKINDQSAVAQYQYFPLDQESSHTQVTVESARLIKADGKIEDHTSDSEDTTISFPSLAPGDIIDVRYRTEDRATGALAHQFWSEWGFESPESQHASCRYVLITPKGMSYNFVKHGDAPDSTEKTIGNWHIRQWDLTNGPVIKDEVLEPPSKDWSAWVDVSTVTSWKQIVDWYKDLSDPICAPTEPVTAKAADLTKGLATDDQKIAALVQFVSHDVQYQSSPFRLSAYIPTEGKQVIRERYGDCKDKAALLISMLSSLGIKGHMVLLSPNNYGTTPYLPSPRFAHAIAVVDAPGGPLWVDGTADGMPYRGLPMGDQGAPALEITPETTGLTNVPNLPTDTEMSTVYAVKLTADGKASIKMTLTFLDDGAWGMRASLRKVPLDKQDDYLRLLAQKLIGAEYDSGTYQGLDDSASQVVITISCHDDHFATPAGDFLLFGLPWASQFNGNSESYKSDTRTHPLDLIPYRHKESSDITIDLPAGYTPQNLATQTEKNAWSNYQFSYSIDGGELKCHAEKEIMGATIAPADVPAYLNFLTDMTTAGTGKMVIKKGAG